MIYGTHCTRLCIPHILVSCLWNIYPKRAVSSTLNNPHLGSKITGLVKDVPFRVTMNGDLSSMNLIFFQKNSSCEVGLPRKYSRRCLKLRSYPAIIITVFHFQTCSNNFAVHHFICIRT